MVEQSRGFKPKEVLGEVLKWTGIVVGAIGLLNGKLADVVVGTLVGVSGVLLKDKK